MLRKAWERCKAHRIYTVAGVVAVLCLFAWASRFAELSDAGRWAVLGVGVAIFSLVWYWACWPWVAGMVRRDREKVREKFANQTSSRERVGNDRSRRRRNRPAGRRK